MPPFTLFGWAKRSEAALSHPWLNSVLSEGLEDAWVFAELARAGRLSDYNRLRRPVDRRVVRQVRLLSSVVAAESSWHRFLRVFLIPAATRVPFIRSRMIRTLSGLDHDLPVLPASRRLQEVQRAS